MVIDSALDCAFGWWNFRRYNARVSVLHQWNAPGSGSRNAVESIRATTYLVKLGWWWVYVLDVDERHRTAYAPGTQ